MDHCQSSVLFKDVRHNQLYAQSRCRIHDATRVCGAGQNHVWITGEVEPLPVAPGSNKHWTCDVVASMLGEEANNVALAETNIISRPTAVSMSF